MADMTETVTLTAGEVVLKTPGDTELAICDAALYSDCHPDTLRRLDNAAAPGFPKAHRKLGSITRLWFAREVADIIKFRVKALEEHRRKTSKIFKLRNASIKAARAEKKAAGAA